MRIPTSTLILFTALNSPILSAAQGEACGQVQTIVLKGHRLIDRIAVLISDKKKVIAGKGAKLFQELVVEKVAADFSHSQVVLKMTDADGQKISVRMKLGKRLGGGVFGNVYVVDEIDNPAIMGIGADGKMVVKFPHSLSGLEKLGPPAVTKDAIRRENVVTDKILSQIDDVKADPQYPKDPSWKDLPLIPITNMIESSSGPLIFKPMLTKAKFLNDIAKLTPEMEASLKDIFDLVQSVHKRTGLSIDIRPPNFAWVDDAEMLKAVGLKRPGWVAFEMDQVAQNIPHYIESNGYTFEDFLKEFNSYLGPKKAPVETKVDPTSVGKIILGVRPLHPQDYLGLVRQGDWNALIEVERLGLVPRMLSGEAGVTPPVMLRLPGTKTAVKLLKGISEGEVVVEISGHRYNVVSKLPGANLRPLNFVPAIAPNTKVFGKLEKCKDCTVSISTDALSMVTRTAGGKISLWDVGRGKKVKSFSGQMASFSPDGRTLVIKDGDSSLFVDAKTGKKIGRFNGLQGSLSPDRDLAVTSDAGASTCTLWDVKSGKALHTYVGVNPVFSSTGPKIATESGDGRVFLWDTKTGQQKISISGSRPVFNPDGQTLAVESIIDKIDIRGVSQGYRLSNIDGKSLSFSKGGEFFVTVSKQGGAIKVWEAKAKSPFKHLDTSGHGKVVSARVSSDGTRIVTISDTGMLVTWDVKSGKVLTAFEQAEGAVTVSGDGTHVVDASKLASGELRVSDNIPFFEIQ